MHLYVMARAIQDRLNRWENDLLARYYPYQNKMLKDSKQPGALQLGLRPIRLYEIAFPREALQDVLSIVQPEPAWNSKYQKFIWMLNKMLKLDKIPEPTKPKTFFHKDFVQVTGIGCKEDKIVDGIEQI